MKYLLTIIILSCIGCSDNANYLIKKGKVGKIHSKSIVKEIDSLFSNDSIVKRIGGGDYMFESEDKYLIYDNSNNHLLTLIPKQQHDRNEKIETIQIFSNKFQTSKGININSSFGDINNKHKISSIQNTINNVVVFVDEIDAYFIIDKENFALELRIGSEKKIESINIPSNSKIKRFMIGWN